MDYALTGFFHGDLPFHKTAGSLVTQGICGFESAEPTQTSRGSEKPGIPAVMKGLGCRLPRIGSSDYYRIMSRSTRLVNLRTRHRVSQSYEGAHCGCGK